MTNLGEARNAVIVWSADAVITLDGWIILAHNGTPLPDPTTPAANPQQAVDLALTAARS